MTKLRNALDTLKLRTCGSLLFRDWKCEDVEGAQMVSATFYYDGAEVKIMEWLNCLDETCSPDSYYSQGCGQMGLMDEMSCSQSTAYLAYKAFTSEFNIAYNLVEGE